MSSYGTRRRQKPSKKHLMRNPKASAKSARADSPWRRYTLVAVAGLAVGVLTVFGPRIASMVGQRMGAARIAACRFGAAGWWLAWSVRFDPRDYRTDLFRAACHRQLNQARKWEESLREARRKGAPDREIRLEERLGRIQTGGLEQPEPTEIAELTAAGAPSRDILAALFHGYLVRQDLGKAVEILDHLPDDFRDQADYLWGTYWRKQGDRVKAEPHLRRALDAQPGHELARGEMAALVEDQDQLDRALGEYVELAAHSGGGEAGTVGLARVLRKLSRVDEARAILAPLDGQPDASSAVEVEMALIELESGRLDEAQRRLDRLRPDQTLHGKIYYPVLVALGLRTRGAEARYLGDQVDQERARQSRMFDLRDRLTNDPGDRAAAGELQQLMRQWRPLSLTMVPGEASGNRADAPSRTTADLYAEQCAACHGATGDGHGSASRHFFPRPRNLRAGRSQLVSTRNGVPTLEDLEKVLAQGMPGTSMPKFDALSVADRRRLAEEVLRLRREGVREEVTKALLREGEEIDEAEVRRAVEVSTIAAGAVRAPREWPDRQTSAARGREIYVALGCVKCHGEDGTGAADQWLFDDQGDPSRPRDLVHEPFKGGREPESIYLRIVAGMPGTAHPAAWSVPEGQLIDLVQYMRSLTQGPPEALTNFERRKLADVRDYLARLRSPGKP